MIFRNFRRISTGQWLDVILTVDGPAFSVLAETHRAQIAAGFGIALVDVEVRDSSADARTGTLISGPPPVAPPPDPDLAAWDAGTVAEKLAILRRRVLTR